MTTLPIIESGMTFGPFPEGSCFHIEKSHMYTAIKNHVKVAEFVVLDHKKSNIHSSMWIVEAKSSSPDPVNKTSIDFFISEVREKFVNAYALMLALCLGRHPDHADDFKINSKAKAKDTTAVKFVLVIKGHKKEWLPPLKDKLENALRATMKTWALEANAVMVLNEELALKHKLLLATNIASAS